jgi:transposase-like protein
MARKRQKPETTRRNNYSEEFKREAVQMLLDGHSATSIVERLGVPGTTMLYRWRRVKMERDILKKALVIFGRIM